MNIQTIFVAALLMGLGGCATAPAYLQAPALTCAPTGYERLDGWIVLDSVMITWPAPKSESGEPVDIVMVYLSRGNKTLSLMFIGDDLILVDPNPADRSVPLLVNERWFTADNKIKSEPSGACAWRPFLIGESA